MNLLAMNDPQLFHDKVYDLLVSHEARYCLPLGIIDNLIKRPQIYPIYYLWLLEEEGQSLGAAWLTPPQALGITAMPPAALPLLVAQAQRLPDPLNGVTGPKDLVEAFSQLWCQVTPYQVASKMGQGIYQAATAVCPFSVLGAMRTAGADDYELLAAWNQQYAIDCRLPANPEDMHAAARAAIANGNRELWVAEGRPVAMAAYQGHTPSGVRISWVYTPKEYRGRGYASALTATLTQKLLAEGKSFVFLYTDLANPTSNSIYQKIGYRYVCDAAYYQFARKPQHTLS